jgi:hypothetical protein
VKPSLILRPLTGAEQSLRLREPLNVPKPKRPARLWADLRGLVHGLRSIFVILLGATIIVFVTSHRMEINSAAAQKTSRVAAQVKLNAAASLIRQTALNHEKEVEAAAK